jgi:O-antigen/teichoic acid export membrane protein
MRQRVVQVALTESQNSARPAWPQLAGLTGLLRAWLSDRSDRSIAQRMAGNAFLIRVASAALIYASQVVLARWLGSNEFGVYVYVWTVVLLVGDLADLGLATAAQRFVPEYTKRKAFDLLRGYLLNGRWLAVACASGIAITGELSLYLLQSQLADYLVTPLAIACLTVPFYSLMQMQDGIARSYNWINVALLPTYVVRHLAVLAMILGAYLLDLPATAVTAVIAVAVALVVTVLGQTILLNRRLSREVEPGPRAHEIKTWFVVSLPILLVEGFYILLTNADILVMQAFRPPKDVAVYYAAAKTLTLISFVHFAVSAAVAHRFSEYHVTHNRAKLEAILADSIRWTFWCSLGACVVVLAMGQFLLWLFGSAFVDGYRLMFILAIGLMARASVGPGERLLTMVGQQHICAIVYATVFLLNLVLCVVLIPQIGVDGAAVSTAAALVTESVLLFWVTRRRLKLHVFIWGRR